MKTKIYIMSLMLFALGINLSFGQDIYEPNDTYETATPVTCGQQLTAYIQVEGDVDWYEIVMNESGVLEVAVTSVPDNLDLNVEIHGHTCSIGTDAYNQGLSERRAAAVVNYLVSQGVAQNRLTRIGFGETKPTASNKTRKGRETNRRVEVLFTK